MHVVSEAPGVISKKKNKIENVFIGGMWRINRLIVSPSKNHKIPEIFDVSNKVLTPCVQTHHKYLQQTGNFTSKKLLHKCMTYYVLIFFRGFD